MQASPFPSISPSSHDAVPDIVPNIVTSVRENQQRDSEPKGKLGSSLFTWIRTGSAGVSKLLSDFDAFSSLMGFVQVSVAAIRLTRCSYNPVCLTNISSSVARASDYMDATRLPADIGYYTDGDLSKDRARSAYMGITSRVLLTLADAAGTVLWLGDMGVKSCANIASSVGRIPVCSRAGITLLGMTRGFVLAGLALAAMETVREIGQLQSLGLDTSKRWVKLATITAAVALKVFIVMGCANPATLISLGIIATGMGVFNFLYSEYHVNNPDPAKHTIVMQPALLV